MNNIFIRTISGVAYVAFIVNMVICPQCWLFVCLGWTLCGFGIYEFSCITSPSSVCRSRCAADIVGGLLLVGAVDAAFLWGNGSVAMRAFTAAWLAWLIARLVAQLYSSSADQVAVMARSLATQLYIALPLGLMAYIYTRPAGQPLLLAVFIMIWLNDTGAYLVGCTWGRHRLFERVSPKKSWEGFWGGMAFAAGSAFLFYHLFPSTYAANYPLWMLLAMGVLVSCFGTWGDLVESMIKRSAGVKDSGAIIPGHGGILDRIDSLLLVSPAVTLFLLVLTFFC